jgi:hypothetical protein
MKTLLLALALLAPQGHEKRQIVQLAPHIRAHGYMARAKLVRHHGNQYTVVACMGGRERVILTDLRRGVDFRNWHH